MRCERKEKSTIELNGKCFQDSAIFLHTDNKM